MKKFFLKFFITAILVVILVACVSIPAHPGAQNQTISWQVRQKQLAQFTTWEIQGAIAIRTPSKSISAYINWKQTHRNYLISLFGPLDLGHTIIQGNANQIKLQTSHNETFTAKNPELLIEQQLGWTLPVSSLPYWIRGLPVPNKPAKKQFDTYNHLVQLTQEGWKIHYLKYTSVNKIDVPSKIFLSSPQLKLKIVISQWT